MVATVVSGLSRADTDLGDQASAAVANSVGEPPAGLSITLHRFRFRYAESYCTAILKFKEDSARPARQQYGRKS